MRLFSARFSVLAVAILGPGWASVAPAGLAGQFGVVQEEENFRAEPNGTIIGQLAPGTRLTIVEEDGNWTLATIHGFVWMASLQIRDEGEFDLVVSESGGENIRDEPAGRVAGRLVTGAFLEEITRIPGWIEVRRTGWIWTESLELETPVAEGIIGADDEAAPAAGGLEGMIQAGGFIRGGGQGAPILAAPDGDTLGRAQPGSDLRVLSREGNWARVQLEGWVWLPSALADPDGDAEESPVLSVPRAGELSADHERFRGRLVQMELQFISLERAEQVRTDFYEGEPFLLTRSVDADRSFIYVAVPPERLDEVESLVPLARIVVVARVRSGSAAYTGSPILDLLELDRLR